MNIDNQLYNLIKGRKVAIIGPGDYVNKELGEDHGKYLDNSFEIIIRINGLIYIENKEMEKYYGSKYNILFSSFWNLPADIEKMRKDSIHPDRYLSKKSYENLEEKTILFECLPRNLFQNIYSVYQKTIDSKNVYYGNSSVDFYHKAIKYINNIHQIQSTPTTGLLTIIMVLLMEPRKLYVSGITSFLDEKHNAYFDNYMNVSKEDFLELAETRRDGSKIKKKEYFNGKTYNFNHPVCRDHPFKAEQIVFKHLINNKLIKVDKYLKNLAKN